MKKQQKEGQSQSDVKIALATKAKEIKDLISNAENSLPAGRLWQKTKEALSGGGVTEENRRNSVRNKIKPLLDLGLYDTSRRILSSRGYGLEESESLINELPEGANKTLATFPQSRKYSKIGHIGKSGYFGDKEFYTPQEREVLDSNMSQVFKDDPSDKFNSTETGI